MGAQIFILFTLITFSAIFSAIELAFFSLSEPTIYNMSEDGGKNAKMVVKLRNNRDRLLITILIGNTVVDIGATTVATVLATSLFGSKGAGIAAGVMTLLVLIFGEIAPKSVAVAYNKQIALFTARPIAFLSYILSPFIYLLEKVNSFFTSLIGVEYSMAVSEAELKAMTKLSAQHKEIEKYEADIIGNVFQLNDVTVEDIMTGQPLMFMMDADKKILDSLSELTNSQYSRIPVFKGGRHNVIGFVYAKDLLAKASAWLADSETSEAEKNMTLGDLAKHPYYIPYNKTISDLLKEFQRKRAHLALVVNDQGVVLGLVTLEDVLEELVGDIADETDVEKNLIKRIDKKNILVDGDTDLEDITSFFNITLPGESKESISGLILETIGRIPAIGETVDCGKYSCEIVEADEKQIIKVKITKP